jgi:hypothetical protein
LRIHTAVLPSGGASLLQVAGMREKGKIMSSLAAKVIGRCMRMVSITYAAYVFNGSQVLAEAPSAPQSPAVPTAASSPAVTKGSDCQRYIGALSGEKKDKDLLAEPSVQALAPEVADLIACIAVKTDSEAACAPLIATLPSGQKGYSNEAKDCLYTQATYHEARAYPKGTSFLFSEMEWRQCDEPKVCAALREATRTGDETKCADSGAFASICRAYVKMDPSLCRVEGSLPKRSGEEAAVAENCKKAIETRGFLARGLKALADSGSKQEQALARAALGQADACAQLERAALDKCEARYAPPTAAAPASPSPATASPAPGTPSR